MIYSALHKWAEVLIDFSVEAMPGQTAILHGDIEAMELIEACYEKLMKKGVSVDLYITPAYFAEIQMRHAPESVVKNPPMGLLHAVQNADIYIRIGADSNTKLLVNAPLSKLALASKAKEPLMETIMQRAKEKKLRWVYTHFPTAAAAQEADMGTQEYRDFIYSLCYLDACHPMEKWREIEKKQQKWTDYLSKKKQLHFTNAMGTDLWVDVEGMRWINCCGKCNFPDGEVYTGPNLQAKNGGVNGTARYSFPVIYRHVEVRDIELVFEKGAVVQANASKGQDFLRDILSQDPGAKFVGEIAIGTNMQMNRITKNILFDEKFGGTFHLALGRGYPETGNTNASSHHWDITFDLREDGKIKADGQSILENGKFTPDFR